MKRSESSRIGVAVTLLLFVTLASAAALPNLARGQRARTVPFPGSTIIQPGEQVTFTRELRSANSPSPRVITLQIYVVSRAPVEATATYDGLRLTIEAPLGWIVQLVPERQVQDYRCNSDPDVPAIIACNRVPGEPPSSVTFTAVTHIPERPLEAALDLSEPPRCIPLPDETRCDELCQALWDGDPAAWQAQGVTGADARLDAVTRLRAEAGDPATLSVIARGLGVSYLKITRLRFVGVEAGQLDEFIEVTNLGGGVQPMRDWAFTVNGVRLPLILVPVLQPGEVCRISTGRLESGACARLTFSDVNVWPDDAAIVEFRFRDAELVLDRTRYSADPKNQPPPPNLQLVPTAPE